MPLLRQTKQSIPKQMLELPGRNLKGCIMLEINFYCEKCLEPMHPIGPADDIGTTTYECTNKHQTTKPITKEQRDKSEALRQRLKEETTPENIKKTIETAKQNQRHKMNEKETLTGNKLSQADKLMLFFENSGAKLFIDQHGTPFSQLKIYCDTCAILRCCDVLALPSVKHSSYYTQDSEGIDAQTPQIAQIPQEKIVNYPIDSTFFRNWISNLMYEIEDKVPSNEAISSAKNVLKGKAQQEGKRYTLYNRVAPDPFGDGSIWLDATNDNWQVIHITKDGWQILPTTPIPMFRRYSHQLPLIIPKSGGDPWQLLDFINIKKTDEVTRLSTLCTIISYFIPQIAHPALIVSGPQGSAKSWMLSLIRRLVDPSSIDLLSLPENPRELAQQLYHHWVAPYDNITWFDQWVSDMLCRAITGSGISVRKLYTDDEDLILAFKHCIMLNGINVAAQESDLLDRGMITPLQEISSESRISERELNAALEQALPNILGGCLDVLSKALAIYPDIKIKEHQRLADFNEYGCAIAQALGKTETEFSDAYKQKVKNQVEEALNGDDVTLAFIEFCSKEVKSNTIAVLPDGIKHNCWKNTPTELSIKLIYHARILGLDTQAKSWPKSTNALTRRLNKATPSLKAIGIIINNYEGTPRQVEVMVVSPVKKPDPTITEPSVSDDKGVLSNRLCGGDCGNFDKIECPFFRKIGRDNVVPLKCYGLIPPLPSAGDNRDYGDV
jgi:hypothetical protein